MSTSDGSRRRTQHYPAQGDGDSLQPPSHQYVNITRDLPPVTRLAPAGARPLDDPNSGLRVSGRDPALTYDASSSSSSSSVSASVNPFLLPVLIVLLVFFVAFASVAMAFVLYKIYSLKYSRCRCHICLKKVPVSDWEDGSHREKCARRNRNFLASLPTPFDVRCPGCLAYLKLLPKDRGKSFHCDDSDCPFKGGDIQNNGYNRLNCFSCDYDMCDSCAHRRMFILTKFGTNHASAPTTGAVGGITNKAFDITDNCSLCQLEVNMFPVSANQNNVSRPATESRSHVPLVQEPIYGHAGAISNINQNAQEPIYGTLSRGNEPQSLGIPVAPLQGSNQRLSPHPMVSLRASQLSPNPILSTNQLNLSALSNMGSDPPSYSTYNMNLPVATYV